jgi:hypothetical protein
MANQNASDKKDRNGGGDVTKADKVPTPSTDKTDWNPIGDHRGKEDK